MERGINKMKKEIYNERVMEMTAYCSLQAKILGLYDSNYNKISMLNDISPLAIKATLKRREKNLRSLEKLSEEFEQRILDFEKDGVEPTDFPQLQELKKLQRQRKREYEELSNNS